MDELDRLSTELVNLCGKANANKAEKLLFSILELNEQYLNNDWEERICEIRQNERDRSAASKLVTDKSKLATDKLKKDYDAVKLELDSKDETDKEKNAGLRKCAANLVSALEKGLNAVDSQKTYFSAVAGKELVNALIINSTGCDRDEVWEKLENPTDANKKDMLTKYALTYEQLQAIDERFRKERNSVCHHAKIWAWMYGGEPWIKDLYNQLNVGTTQVVRYDSTVSTNITNFLKKDFAKVPCRTCKKETSVDSIENTLRCNVCKTIIVSKYNFEEAQKALEEAKFSLKF